MAFFFLGYCFTSVRGTVVVKIKQLIEVQFFTVTRDEIETRIDNVFISVFKIFNVTDRISNSFYQE